MNAHVWTKIALASALLMGGVMAQAQTSSGNMGAAGQGATGQQTRPAPVTGKVSNDPAAVALRPATQAPAPVTSKATQVAPPANPNEPLFSPSAETPARAAVATTPSAATKPAVESAKPHMVHANRTEGVKKPGKTTPQPHEKKVTGAPHHAARGAGKDEGSKGNKGKKKSDKQAAMASAVKGAHVAKADAGKKAGNAAARPAKAHHGKVSDKAAMAHTGTGKATKKTVVAHKATTQKLATQKAAVPTPHAKAAHVAAHKSADKATHSRQAVARSAATKASAPSGKKPAKAARAHKAAA